MRVYFDNAATTSPKPFPVREAAGYALKNLCANPGRSGHTLGVRAGESVYRVREKLARFFGLPDDGTVVFTKNCTEALNIAIRGLVHRGDHVVTSVLEHNSVLRPLEKLRLEGVITYDKAPVYADTEKTLSAFKRLIRKNTRLIVCTHVSNVFGTVLPIKELADMAKKHGAYFVLDAAQSAGVYDIQMSGMSIDALCLPGHKGLYGPTGTGCLLLNSGVTPEPLMQGGTGSFSASLTQPGELPDLLESGTLNVPGIVGLGAGLDFIGAKGIESIRSHEQALVSAIKKGLERIPGITIYSPPNQSTTLLSFTLEGQNSEETAMYLNSKGIAVRAGYHCAFSAHRFYGTEDTGTVRVSPSLFSTKQEVDYLLRVLSSGKRSF